MKKRVLLYLGKFPGYGFDIDGGSILARQLIDTLKESSILDVVFIRKNNETFSDSQVNNIRYVDYKYCRENKFVRRLKNLDTNRNAIGDYNEYDVIVTAHISKFFGFEDAPSNFWSKTVLFPMFCTSSYIRAGEDVPNEYTHHEKIVMNRVSRIITPSSIEKDDLIRDYCIDPYKIHIVYRGINPVFVPVRKEAISSTCRIVCIGSIKKQKNSLEAIVLLHHLRKSGLDVELHMVCTIQDELMFLEMQKYIDVQGLKDYVRFHYQLSQKEVAQLLQNMDINISVSNWETFGRGIFEGISTALPTIVFNKLTEVKVICNNNPGVIFVENVIEMASKIIELINNPQKYSSMKNSLISLRKIVSYQKEAENLRSLILQ